MIEDYPPAAFSFRVSFAGGGGDASFVEASGIGPEIETEAYHEGGENSFVHALPKGVKHPKLSLRRGIADRDSALVQWCRETFEGGFARPLKLYTISLYLLDEAAKPLRGWSFQDAYPVSWSVDPFHADRNVAAIEKIDFAYAAAVRTV